MTLREYRESKGLLLRDVAKKLNVTVAAVSQWELGRNNILRKYVAPLAKVYGCSKSDIVAAVQQTKAEHSAVESTGETGETVGE